MSALEEMKAIGVYTPLKPQFPSVTFPNHYTLATGLYPINHGIVSNHFFDKNQNLSFSYSDGEPGRPGKDWWRGEPVSVYADYHSSYSECLFILRSG